MKERDAFLERLGLREACLVHYDIGEADARARTAVTRFLFGRIEVRTANGSSKTYRYPGLVAQGAEWVGQSVVIAEPDLADRLIAKLRALGVRHSIRTIYEPRYDERRGAQALASANADLDEVRHDGTQPPEGASLLESFGS